MGRRLLFVLFAAGVAGCDRSPTESEPAITFSIVPAAGATIRVGESFQLTIERPTSSLGAPISWSSANSAVVSVDQTGRVTCHAVGTVAIIATANQQSNSQKSVLVTCVAGLMTVTPTTLAFTHRIGTTGCPQAIGTLELTNTSSGNVQVLIVTHTALTVDASTFLLPPGGSRAVSVSFNCSTQTSFVGTMTLSATGSVGTADIKTVQVTGTITS